MISPNLHYLTQVFSLKTLLYYCNKKSIEAIRESNVPLIIFVIKKTADCKIVFLSDKGGSV